MAYGNRTQTRTTPSQPRSFQRSHALLSGPQEVVIPRLVLILAVFALVVIGLVMVFSSSTVEAITEGAASTSYLAKQAAIALVGIVACAFIAVFMPYYLWLDRWLDLLWVVAVALLVLTAAMGAVGLGAKRWLVIGPVNFQPSELAKVAFILVAARVVYRYRQGELDFQSAAIRGGLCVLMPLFFMFVAQSDLGTTLICLVGILAVLWIAEVPLGIFLGLIGGVAAFGVAAILIKSYRGSRMAFLDPWADPYGDGYQLIHSFYAFAQGGLFGTGIGNSREKYLYLPEAETDFIFAIVGEEMGLIGCLIIIALFVAFLYAGLKIARNAPDEFGAMVAGGCTIMLVFQAFLNIGCVVGLLPTTGKPLPFISSGGTSLLGSFLLVGVILSVSFASGNDSGVYERRRADLRVVRVQSDAPRGYRTTSSTRSGSGATRASGTRVQGAALAPARSRGMAATAGASSRSTRYRR